LGEDKEVQEKEGEGSGVVFRVQYAALSGKLFKEGKEGTKKKQGLPLFKGWVILGGEKRERAQETE